MSSNSTAASSSRRNGASCSEPAASVTSTSSCSTWLTRRRPCSSRWTTTRCSGSWTRGCRQVLAPALPAGVTLVLAGRERPVAAWLGIPGFRNLPLGPLDGAEAQRMLERRGVPSTEAGRLNRIARGHPLALILASAGVAEHPELALEDAAMTRVVRELARRYLEGVGDRADARVRWRPRAWCAPRRSRCSPRCSASADGGSGRATFCSISRSWTPARVWPASSTRAVREAVAGYLNGANPVRYRAAAPQRLARAAHRGPRGRTR